MEDIDELRRALEAATMRAAAAEAVAGQAEQRIADLEGELKTLRAQRQAERGVNPSKGGETLSEALRKAMEAPPWITDGPRPQAEQRLIQEAQRRMMSESPKMVSYREVEERIMRELLTGYSYDVDRMEMRPSRMSRMGGRRVSIHYQAESGNIMLRADTGRTTSDSAEYICVQVNRHDRTNKVMSVVVDFVQELDKVKRVTKPTRTVDDLIRGIERVRTKRGEYTVEIE